MSGIQNGWWTAVGTRATFTFQVQNGAVVTAPPYGWSLLGGKSARMGIRDLQQMGFELHAPTFEKVTS